MTRSVTVALYVAVIGISAVVQGCAAAYYYSRRRHMTAYLQGTPKWVVEALHATAA